ncbi:MAG TPA: nucleotidyl transferase AbiEii/AbiGii toxin family protein [Steroidobacteraceae bacterium]|nr:nucleotidyl transferase AbiEii/AbiGii toxin family protein [Steroidobacteraceae bacterium]
MWTERQAIEVFHLLFLRSFGARVDKTLFALKGGCNLRFYHRSIRYSEDMDLDLRTMAPGTLRSKVDAVLAADPFRHSLRAQGLEISAVTAPKQTAITQRWKIALRLTGLQDTLPTKIEFSRRALDDGAELAPVEPELIRQYKLYPVLVQRYSVATAFAQKVAALALRTETQARDIFDIKLLLDAGAMPAGISPELVHTAIENAMTISFDDFSGQVVAYLEPEHQSDYRERASFDTLQDQVLDALRALQP